MKDEIIVIMVKDPRYGNVKSRLAEKLGKGLAETLYRCFVADILHALGSIAHPRVVAFTPSGSQESVEEWIGTGIPLMEQRGSDLGERMKNLFLDLFREGYSRVVLVGSDIPDLTADLVEEAFSVLKTCDGVIGPAMDGGYYLIGFTPEGFSPSAFQGIEWGTDQVYERTMRLFLEQGCRFRALPIRSDMDTVTDLRDLYERHGDGPSGCSRTIACIKKHAREVLA
jgi:hypothetical protein